MTSETTSGTISEMTMETVRKTTMAKRNKQEEQLETNNPTIVDEGDSYVDEPKEGYIEGLAKQINYDFASNWREMMTDQTNERLDAYLKTEIQNLIDNDYAVLSTILQMKEITPKTRALLLFQRATEFSHYSMVKLSLVPAELRTSDIPAHDYNGCLLPVAKRGKVLAAKCAFRAEYDNEVKSAKEDEASTQKMFNKYGAQAAYANAEKAKRIYKHPSGPYVCIEIGENGTLLSIGKAVSILSNYGYGVAVSKTGRPKLWLVQEEDLIGEGQ